MSEVPNSRTPGRRIQYILHGGAKICGFLVWKLRHVTLEWNFEVRFSENLCTLIFLSVCVHGSQQYLVAFVNVVMKRFSYHVEYLMAN